VEERRNAAPSGTTLLVSLGAAPVDSRGAAVAVIVGVYQVSRYLAVAIGERATYAGFLCITSSLIPSWTL